MSTCVRLITRSKIVTLPLGQEENTGTYSTGEVRRSGERSLISGYFGLTVERVKKRQEIKVTLESAMISTPTVVRIMSILSRRPPISMTV